MNIISKIIGSLREIYAMAENNEETNTIIDTLDKELEDIGSSADVIIAAAEKHLGDRLKAGETESVSLSVKSHDSFGGSALPPDVLSHVSSKSPSEVPSKVPFKLPSEVPSKVPPNLPSKSQSKAP